MLWSEQPLLRAFPAELASLAYLLLQTAGSSSNDLSCLGVTHITVQVVKDMPFFALPAGLGCNS